MVDTDFDRKALTEVYNIIIMLDYSTSTIKHIKLKDFLLMELLDNK